MMPAAAAARPKAIANVLGMQLVFWSIFLLLTGIGLSIVSLVPIYGIGPAMFLYVPIMLAVIFVSMSRFSGWHELSRIYRTRAPIPCELFWRSPANMRAYLGYRGGLIGLGANEHGLYLTSALLLRLFNPPLFVPWKDLQVEERVSVPFTMFSWPGERCIFHFRKKPPIVLAISTAAADHLKAGAGASWPSM